MSAPPAMPALRVSQPALWPMTSTMNTRLWEAAVVWMQSMTSVARPMADWKPKVVSVPHRSLSMVLGRPMTFSPSSLRRLAVFWLPLPPSTTSPSSRRRR